MSMHITSQATSRFNFYGAGSTAAADRLDKSEARRDSFKQLSQALSSGDMSGARNAYASLVKNAPAAASWRPDSPFAQLGKALITGDMSAAQTSFDAMAVNRLKQGDGTQAPVVVAPKDPVATTNGAPSVAIDLVA